MKESDRDKLKEKLLALVPVDGTSIGNVTLRAALEWELVQYQELRDELVREGVIEPWRGRGGTVRRTSVLDATQASSLKPREVEKAEKEEKEEVTKHRMIEAKLYPPLLACLKLWAKDQGWTDFVVNQIAHQGRRSTGGVWTRPDFVVIGYRKFEYTPGIVRDLETFEVKTSACGIESVFETAAHSRVATKSYLIIQKTDEGPSADALDRIESEIVRFGLGLIVFTDAKDFETWEYRVEPNRQEPDPFNVEEFIQTQIPTAEQERIRKWLR